MDPLNTPPKPTRFVLEGGGGLEDVPAEDVAKFISEVVRIVARAAGHAVMRPVKETGRHQAIVAAASRIRLQSVRSGSVAITMLPSEHRDFNIGDNLGLDAETVSDRALKLTREAAGDLSLEYPDLAKAWADLADEVGIGARYKRVVITQRGVRKRSVVDSAARDRLRAVSAGKLRGMATETLQGVLYHANFETHKATLRTSPRETLVVEFDDSLAQQIKDALREPRSLRGEVSFDPRTNRAVSVRVSRIERPEQLGFRDFWAGESIAELLKRQGVEPIHDVSELVVPGISDEDWAGLRGELGIEA